eukprot:Skav223758  [mRNA]  locus=scaffold7728:1247:15865:- [translate_table: standard]
MLSARPRVHSSGAANLTVRDPRALEVSEVIHQPWFKLLPRTQWVSIYEGSLLGAVGAASVAGFVAMSAMARPNRKFADVPSGLAAISKARGETLSLDVPLEGWLQDPAERKLKLTTELNNGRLAMVAMTAMLIQNGLTGQSPVEQLTSGHISPFNDGQGFFAQFDPSQDPHRHGSDHRYDCARSLRSIRRLPVTIREPVAWLPLEVLFSVANHGPCAVNGEFMVNVA